MIEKSEKNKKVVPKRMSIRDQVNDVVKDNFVPDECDVDALLEGCQLMYITGDGEILFKQLPLEGQVNSMVGVCFTSGTTIVCFCIHRDFQRRGHGLSLLKAAVEAMGKAKLVARKSNRGAISLYKRVGFKVMYEVPEFYSYTSKNETGVEMEFAKRK